MYKSFTAKDFIGQFNLPEDYRVDGLLFSGTYKKAEHKEILKKVLMETNKDVVFETLTSFLRDILVFTINGKRFWFDVVYGSAYLSEIIHLGCLFGSQKNILLGVCGGLGERGNAGDIILPTYSFGDESTTRMYQPEITTNIHLPAVDLTNRLKSKIDSKFIIHEGPIMTCQAMLGEKWEDIIEWSKQGYLGVEMESSTVFAVSRHFGVPSAALLVIGDNLIKGDSVGSENYELTREWRNQVREHTFKIALEEIINSN